VTQDYWRLPKGVDEVLPPQARHLELTRRQLLDLFDSWGYDFIEPPIIEYLDALLVGNDLSLQTLQAADQISGRALGVRADITAQAARIDANSLSDAGKDDTSVRRLCYAGPVVRANPSGVLESRVPLKIGAEIYGSPEVGADLEIMCLAIDALGAAGVETVVLELGHVGFVRELVDGLQLSDGDRERLLEAVRIKSEADIQLLLAGYQVGGKAGGKDKAHSEVAQQLCQLVRLMGGASVLEGARELFLSTNSKGSEQATKLLELVAQLDYCAARLASLRPEAEVRFDLSAPVGYGYHQALVFALYEPGHSRAIARGGRYDGIGEQFGNARAATGFDVNLKSLIGLDVVQQRFDAAVPTDSIWVDYLDDGPPELEAAVSKLRAQGNRIVRGLGPTDRPPQGCRKALRHKRDGWQVTAISDK